MPRWTVAGALAGIRCPVIRANREDGPDRIGGQSVIMACGGPMGHKGAPTLFGEPPTYPMYGEALTYRTAATVTGARSGIPTPSGEARMEAGVIRRQ